MSRVAQTGEKVEDKKGFSMAQVIAIVLGAMLLTIVITIISIKLVLFPDPFTPVQLSQKEKQEFSTKLERLEKRSSMVSDRNNISAEKREISGLQPEKYSEEEASKDIFFTEREINAMVAQNTDLAEKMVIDLSNDLLSLKLLLPMDPDLPIMGGKTLRVTAGAELAYREGRPVVKLKGVSLMGIPMPNAWLGGIKNIDLVEEYGGNDGFWKSFADGVDNIHVEEGTIHIILK